MVMTLFRTQDHSALLLELLDPSRRTHSVQNEKPRPDHSGRGQTRKTDAYQPLRAFSAAQPPDTTSAAITALTASPIRKGTTK